MSVIPPPPWDIDAIEERLDQILEAALSSRRTAVLPAQRLSQLSREQQDLVLHWTQALARSNPELAFHFASHAAEALAVFDHEGFRDWIQATLALFDRQGVRAALVVMKDPLGFSRRPQAQRHSVLFSEGQGAFEKFVRGLGGRPLTLVTSEQTTTDTETLSLPSVIHAHPHRKDNHTLYLRLLAQLWGQSRFGLYRRGLPRYFNRFPDPEKTGRIFFLLENSRIDGILSRMLPGLHARSQKFAAMGLSPTDRWHQAISEMNQPQASQKTALSWLPQLWDRPLPPSPLYYGKENFLSATQRMAERIQKEKIRFRKVMGKLLHQQPHEKPEERWKALAIVASPTEEGVLFEIHLDGKPLALPESLQQLLISITQDLGKIPPDYLEAAGPGFFNPEEESELDEEPAATAWSSIYHEEGALLFDEWDHHRQDYRKNWCVLRELVSPLSQEPFVEKTLEKRRGLLREIRRSFELFKGADQVLKRQANGDEIDLDALIEAKADHLRGKEFDDRLFLRMERNRRDVAALFLVDMSGSTKGWVNEAIRESLILLCEGLEILGDRYAIYGFSGMTRKKCELFRIKPFEETSSERTNQRIAAIRPLEYTRLGVFIRYGTRQLTAIEARIRLLIILSDGRPEDYDGYRGKYALEDTKKAIIETRRQAIHPFCITIDKEGGDYLPHIFGPSGFTLLPTVSDLPLKITDIYRKLTS